MVSHQDGALGRNSHAVARLLVKAAPLISAADLEARHLARGVHRFHKGRGGQTGGQLRVTELRVLSGRKGPFGRLRHQAEVIIPHIGLRIIVKLPDQRIIAPHHPYNEADGDKNGEHADCHPAGVGAQISPNQFEQQRHKASFSVRS